MKRSEFDKLKPKQQGYTSYMEAAKPGSEIPKRCPYTLGSKEHQEWMAGEMQAVLHAQDDEG